MMIIDRVNVRSRNCSRQPVRMQPWS